jgi:hypothetical protein
LLRVEYTCHGMSFGWAREIAVSVAYLRHDVA